MQDHHTNVSKPDAVPIAYQGVITAAAINVQSPAAFTEKQAEAVSALIIKSRKRVIIPRNQAVQ